MIQSQKSVLKDNVDAILVFKVVGYALVVKNITTMWQ